MPTAFLRPRLEALNRDGDCLGFFPADDGNNSSIPIGPNDRDGKIGISTYCGFRAIGGDAHIRSSIAETVDLLNSSCIFVEQDLVSWSRT